MTDKTMRKWKILARHKWVAGAVITESVNDDNIRRFTAKEKI